MRDAEPQTQKRLEKANRRTLDVALLGLLILAQSASVAAGEQDPSRGGLSPAIAETGGLTCGPNATVLKNGRPYRGIGINYFDCFLRTLKNGDDTSYDPGFATLESKGIPFVRFCATGFWPKDMGLYRQDRTEYFRRLDGVVKSAEKHGIGLVPSLFWSYKCVPDLVGEPMDQWANPQSKTRVWMREYVREVVTRYRENPTIWAWEFGNEYSLAPDLPNSRDHLPAVHPKLGEPKTRSERDCISFTLVRNVFTEFAKEVRALDPERLIITGDSFLRPSAWHQEHEKTWTKDTPEQFAEMLRSVNPDPINTISLHLYLDEEEPLLAAAQAVAHQVDKPIIVGEFGTPGDTPEEAAKCRRLLKAIMDHDIPLAALWVFDLPSQNADFSVTADNARAWQLDLISEANKSLSRQGQTATSAKDNP